MADFITAITGANGISSDALWTEATKAAPLVVIIFIFAFGYRILKKVTKSGSKGKVNV